MIFTPVANFGHHSLVAYSCTATPKIFEQGVCEGNPVLKVMLLQLFLVRGKSCNDCRIIQDNLSGFSCLSPVLPGRACSVPNTRLLRGFLLLLNFLNTGLFRGLLLVLRGIFSFLTHWL